MPNHTPSHSRRDNRPLAKRLSIILIASVILFPSVACPPGTPMPMEGAGEGVGEGGGEGLGEGAGEGTGEGLGEMTPTGAALWEEISVTDPFDMWATFPGITNPILSGSPHGPMANVFISTEVEGAVASGALPLPPGSIIVKQSFDPDTMDEAGDAITVMWKVEGFNPTNNDWFWASFGFDGTVLAEGALSGCAGCHGSRRSNDFIFLHTF